jgi:hypothetical protein
VECWTTRLYGARHNKVGIAERPFATEGFYPNHDAGANPDHVAGAFGIEKYKPPAATEGKYNPKNIFCLNQNIQPAVAVV